MCRLPRGRARQGHQAHPPSIRLVVWACRKTHPGSQPGSMDTSDAHRRRTESDTSVSTELLHGDHERRIVGPVDMTPLDDLETVPFEAACPVRHSIRFLLAARVPGVNDNGHNAALTRSEEH